MNKTLKVLALALTSLLSVTAVYGQRQVADSIGLVRSLSNSPQDMISGKVSGVGVSNIDGSHISGKSLNTTRVRSTPRTIPRSATKTLLLNFFILNQLVLLLCLHVREGLFRL